MQRKLVKVDSHFMNVALVDSFFNVSQTADV